MKLYWVTTEDHDEDWFIVAPSPTEASQYHENMEGYNPGDAKAEEILEFPEKGTTGVRSFNLTNKIKEK